MPDRARLGTVAAAVCVLLPFGPAVASAAPAVNQTTLAQEQLRNLPQGLWGLLGLLGLFGLVGLARRGPKRNAKNPLAGYSGEDETARNQGRHHAPPAQRTGSPTDLRPGGGMDRNPQAERPPAVAMDPAAQMPRPEAPMPDPRRPVAKTPADVPMPSYTPAEIHTTTDGHAGAQATPAYPSADMQSGTQATPAYASSAVPSGAQPAYSSAEAPSGAQALPQVGSPMDMAPTAPTPALHRRTPESFPQTDQDPPPPPVPQQQGSATGTFAGLPRYPETAAPDPGPVDAGPRHRR